MTCPICSFQTDPQATIERGLVCDKHFQIMFEVSDKQKTPEELAIIFSVPKNHALVEHIRKACEMRDNVFSEVARYTNGGRND